MANKRLHKVRPGSGNRVGKLKPEQILRKYNERVQKEFVSRLKASRIPAYQALAGDPQLLIKFFLDPEFYGDVLGSSYALFQRIFKQSITAIVARDIQLEVIDNPIYVLPGSWDDMAIKSLIMTSFNIATVLDAPERGFALNANGLEGTYTAEQVKDFTESSWMYFGDYSPERLYLFCRMIQQVTLVRITREITDHVPAVMMAIDSETAEHRFGRQIGELLVQPLAELVGPEYEALELKEQADRFIHAVEGPLLSYTMAALSESGFSRAIIERVLGHTKANVVYNVDAGSGKEIQYFIHPWVRMDYILLATVDNRQFSARLQVCPRDLQLAATDMDAPELQVVDSHVDTKAIRDQALNRIGRSMVKFINELVKYTLNVYLTVRTEPLESESNATEIPGPDGQDVSEPEVVDGGTADPEVENTPEGAGEIPENEVNDTQTDDN